MLLTLARLHPQIFRTILGIVLVLWRAIWHINPFRVSHTAVGRNLTSQHVRDTSLVQKPSKKQSLRTRPFWSCPNKSINLRVHIHTDIVRELVGILSNIEQCLKASVERSCAPCRVLQRSRQVNLCCTALHICCFSRW